ncbi:hypothetical protein OAK91_06690, partial [Planctomycetaceae bacterium]|nr:hypothetical protein [Planctomycetaceae bacterium]
LLAQEKFDIPDARIISENVKLVQQLYAEELKSIDNAFQRMQIADKLIDEAKSSQNASSQYALLSVAKEIYLEGSDFVGAITVLEEIDKRFKINALNQKIQTLDQAISSRLDEDMFQQLFYQFDELIDEAIRNNDFDSANDLGVLANSCAKKTRDRILQAEAKSLAKDVKAMEAVYVKYQKGIAELIARPEDSKASLEVGRFLCFINSDWKKGLPLLARGTDQKLREIAMKELEDMPNSLEFGDAWWELSEMLTGLARRNAVDHARKWYRKAAPVLSGLQKAKVDSRLSNSESVTPFSATLAAPGRFKNVISEDQHYGAAGDLSENHIYEINLDVLKLTNGANIRIHAQAATINRTSNGNILLSIDGGDWIKVEKWTSETCIASQRYNNWQKITIKSPDQAVARQIRMKFEFTNGKEALVINYVGWVR